MRRKVLVIDDEPEILEILTSILGYVGFDVLPACNAEAGLDEVQGCHGEIHAIISDYKMPGMNGSEFFSRICASGIQVEKKILISASLPETIRLALPADCKILPKPFTMDQLIESIGA
jgi:CheY-like chemotaxis protein